MNENIKLEEKIAYLEHHVTEQDKVLLQLVDDVKRLRKELFALRERLAGPSAVVEVEESTDERPPHY